MDFVKNTLRTQSLVLLSDITRIARLWKLQEKQNKNSIFFKEKKKIVLWIDPIRRSVHFGIECEWFKRWTRFWRQSMSRLCWSSFLILWDALSFFSQIFAASNLQLLFQFSLAHYSIWAFSLFIYVSMDISSLSLRCCKHNCSSFKMISKNVFSFSTNCVRKQMKIRREIASKTN